MFSLGAIAASIFMLSSTTKNLFKRVIMQSGASTVYNSFYRRSYEATVDLLEIVGCSDQQYDLISHPKEVITCMRNMPQGILKKATDDQIEETLLQYSPVVDHVLLPLVPLTAIESMSR